MEACKIKTEAIDTIMGLQESAVLAHYSGPMNERWLEGKAVYFDGEAVVPRILDPVEVELRLSQARTSSGLGASHRKQGCLAAALSPVKGSRTAVKKEVREVSSGHACKRPRCM